MLIGRAMGAPDLTYAHLSLLHGPDGRKLSKRHGDTALRAYREAGIVADAMVNYLALLGWSSGDDREIFSRDELIEVFDLSGITKSNAVYNFIEGHPTKWLDQKALWMNSQYIRGMELDELVTIVRPWLEREGLWDGSFAAERGDWFRATIDALRERAFTLRDFPLRGRPYFTDDYEFEPKAIKNLTKTPELAPALEELGGELATVAEWTPEATETLVRGFGDARGIGSGPLINGVRAAVTGQTVGPGLFVVLDLLGRERTCARLSRASQHAAGSLRNGFDDLRAQRFDLLVRQG
jgi:glutamyl-tRNA synthetase